MSSESWRRSNKGGEMTRLRIYQSDNCGEITITKSLVDPDLVARSAKQMLEVLPLVFRVVLNDLQFKNY